MIKIKSNKKKWQVLFVEGKLKTGARPLSVPRIYLEDDNGNYVRDEFNRLKYEEADHEFSDNFIFKASFNIKGMSKGQSSVLTSFVDEDDGHVYWASSIAMALIMRAIIDGKLSVMDGVLTGFWTLRKMGATISIWPVRRIDVDKFEEYKNTELDNYGYH